MTRHAITVVAVVLIVVLLTSWEPSSAGTGGASTGATPSGVTLDQIPLSWKHSIVLQGADFTMTGSTVSVVAPAPPTHGFLIESFAPLTEMGVRFLVNGLPTRSQQWVGTNAPSLYKGHQAPLLIRPDETLTIELEGISSPSGNLLGFADLIDLDIALIPASELPPIPPM